MSALIRPLILWLMVLALTAPTHALAAPRLAPGIISVQPGTVSNATSTSFLVTGSGFLSATVSLDSFGVLPTSGTDSVLTAQLPAGVPSGTYTVRVTNSDGSAATLPNALTVVGPTATPAPTQFSRPVLVVQSYGASAPEVAANENYDFEMTLQNAGGAGATNIIVTFTSGDFLPTLTGGTRAVGNLGPGQSVRFFQPLVSTSGLSGKRIATLEVKVSYVTDNGTAYNDSFNLTFPVRQFSGVAGPTATPTPTPTLAPQLRPQLLISAYESSVEPLTAGARFVLNITVTNRGNATARRVVAVLGGGGSAGGGSGTPTAPGGGIGAGGGDFSNFAPLDASNVVPVGDLAPGQSASISQNIIVNATIKPGAFPLKYSFVYQDERNNGFTDEQVITLLVYQPPIVDVNFYRDPNPIFSQQTTILPLQIVNLSRNLAVLGTVEVKANGVLLPVQNAFVGALEAGLPFQLDPQFTPLSAGPQEVTVFMNYTDDFNQQRVISKTLTVNVQEGGGVFPPDGGGTDGGGVIVDPQPPAQEDFFAWLWRLIRGLLGLDSGQNTTPNQQPPMNTPGELPPGSIQLLPPPDVIITEP